MDYGKGAGWQRFAIWIARRDGSVAALCPVVPQTARVDAEELVSPKYRCTQMTLVNQGVQVIYSIDLKKLYLFVSFFKLSINVLLLHSIEKKRESFIRAGPAESLYWRVTGDAQINLGSWVLRFRHEV